MDNDLCREVLGARTYETLPTADHPEGQILSNWFLRRIEDKDTGGIEVTGAKTGYVVESGNCAASCGETADGRRYICVTADAYSSWRAIYDHVALYKTYCSPADDTTEDGGAADPLVEPVAPTIKDTTEHESGASPVTLRFFPLKSLCFSDPLPGRHRTPGRRSRECSPDSDPPHPRVRCPGAPLAPAG